MTKYIDLELVVDMLYLLIYEALLSLLVVHSNSKGVGMCSLGSKCVDLDSGFRIYG